MVAATAFNSSARQNSRKFRLLTEIRERQAIRYVKACEKVACKENTFQDFEQQVLGRLDRIPTHGTFGRAFVELVILDVEMKNILVNLPSSDHFHKLVYRGLISRYRERSQEHWGKTTKYHAKVYRNFIISELATRGLLRSHDDMLALLGDDYDNETVALDDDDFSLS